LIATAILAIFRAVYVLVIEAVALVTTWVVQREGPTTTLTIVLIAAALCAFVVASKATSSRFETRSPAVAVTIVTIVGVKRQASHTPPITVSANATITVRTAIAILVIMPVLSASASASASCRLV
jgi:hypothetical protein